MRPAYPERRHATLSQVGPIGYGFAMPRIPKRLVALGGLIAAGAALLQRRRRATHALSAPAPAPATPPPPPTVPVAPPPPDAPGPSVTPTGPPASSTERAEAAEARVPTPSGPVDDELVDRETAAAAAEAAGIGGPRLDDAHGDPAFEAVYEAGGGESEGFELSEEQLIENATHGGGRGDPSQDAFTAEVEADRSTAVDGEADDAQPEEDDR
jgi:hypothetical protein